MTAARLDSNPWPSLPGTNGVISKWFKRFGDARTFFFNSMRHCLITDVMELEGFAVNASFVEELSAILEILKFIRKYAPRSKDGLKKR